MDKKYSFERDAGVIVRDFKFNGKIYIHYIYTYNDSILVFELGEKKPILLFDNHMNVCMLDDNCNPIQIGRFSIRNDHWFYEHTGDSAIFQHIKNHVMISDIDGMFVRLEHSRGVESNLDSEIYVTKMYLSYLMERNKK